MDRDGYDFVKAFVAALRIEGCESFSAFNDSHQQQFRSVYEAMKWDRHPQFTIFTPSPIIGWHDAFNLGLDRLYREDLITITRGQLIRLNLSPSLAQSILNRYNETDRRLLQGYAKIFLDPTEVEEWAALKRQRVG